jgi:hypothetical protein
MHNQCNNTAYTDVVLQLSLTSLHERINEATISPYTYSITSKSKVTLLETSYLAGARSDERNSELFPDSLNIRESITTSL